jgi:hypothetical protein
MVTYASPDRKQTDVLKLILSISRTIIHDRRTRRGAMFRLLLGALLMVFAGSFLMDDFLGSHLLAFVLFWAACAWLTIAALLLACFDILMVRAEARAAQRQLEREILKTNDPEEKQADDDSEQN